MGKKTVLATLILCLTSAVCGCGASSEYISGGMAAIEEQDYETALDFFDLADENGENHRLISRGMGIAYMELACYEDAILCFEDALSSSYGIVTDMDYDLNYYLASAYTRAGRIQDARNTYDAILNLKSDEVDALFLRGNVLMELGDTASAVEDFDRVVSLDGENYDRLIQIYEVLAYYGESEKGREYLSAAMEENSDGMSALEKGEMYYYLEEYQSAYAVLEEARSDGGADAYLYLGRSYEATGDYNYAATVYNSYLQTDDTNAEIYNQLGICELKLGDYEKALEAFQKGMETEDNTVAQNLSYNEIVAYEYLGDFDMAKILMSEYLKIYPDDEAALREYSFLSTR